MDTSNYLKELSISELKEIKGGNPIVVGLLWMAAGWVLGEIMDGIYQAQQKGCLS